MFPKVATDEDQPAPAQTMAVESYNATLADILEVHEDLRIFRVRADSGPLEHVPGQYVTLGLGNWAPFVGATEVDQAADEVRRRHVIQRAYSFSSRMLDADGRLVDPVREDPAEFYVALVPATPLHPPGLTPRLFALAPGDRLLVSQHAKGTYQARDLAPDDDVLFAATGTGEAPHNGMLADLLRRGHRGRIVSVVCNRRLRDLAYLATHRVLEQRFANYRYLTLTTREPRNLNSQAPGYVGKQYLQEFLLSPELEQALGRPLEPGRLHVYLCGNPEMIGAPRKHGEGGWDWPQPRGVMETLAARGFRPAIHGHAGDVHFEKYW